MTRKTRLDDLMVARGLSVDRADALRRVLAGEVMVAGQRAVGAARAVSPDAVVEVKADKPFVSRGGYKLERALKVFDVDVSGLSCLDCGASTGGFTDCLLQQGAARVCAVDKGYGQFAWKLREDSRVVLFERSDIRKLPFDASGAPFDLAVADISFAPLRSYLPAVIDLLRADGAFITLVKPQFEVGREDIGRHGVVFDATVHRGVLEDAVSAFTRAGLTVEGLTYSPIKGPEGNIEFLLYGRKDVGRKTTDAGPHTDVDPSRTVDEAHRVLGPDRGGE